MTQHYLTGMNMSSGCRSVYCSVILTRSGTVKLRWELDHERGGIVVEGSVMMDDLANLPQAFSLLLPHTPPSA